MKKLTTHENLDTEINLVPIIDCFVILICFLLFTTTFTQLVFLQAKITSFTAQAAAKSRSELDKFHLTIEILDNGFQIKASGSDVKGKLDSTIALKDSSYDFEALHQKIIAIKTNYPDRFSIDLEVKAKRPDSIHYKVIMKTMDMVRHLNDMEYSQVRTVQKKIKKLEISDEEMSRKIDPSLEQLATSILNDAVAANAEQKLLFPDIAIVGVN